jgi:hypothetical protein
VLWTNISITSASGVTIVLAYSSTRCTHPLVTLISTYQRPLRARFYVEIRSTIDNAWDTEDSDIDIDNNEEPSSTFDRLTKGFLLTKSTYRNREPILQRS